MVEIFTLRASHLLRCLIQELNKTEALRCMASGNRRDAHQYWSKAVDVTPAMAHEWIKTIRGVKNLQYVVAPYEVSLIL